MNIKKSIVLRVRIAFLLIFLFSVAVVFRLVKIQVVEGEKWRTMARENLIQYRTVKATRGNIYSDNGSLLATSLPFYKVAFDPTIANDELFYSGIDSLAYHLSSFFRDRSVQEYKRMMINARRSDRRYLILNARTINYQARKELSSWPIFREGRMKGGIIFEKENVRFKPFSTLAKRTVGFMKEDRGAGLEYSFNEILAGRDGEALFRKMAGGNWMPLQGEAEAAPQQGLDIVTTIDINLQDVAESALMRHLQEHDADYGCAVLMEVKTGEIKAMANLTKRNNGAYIEDINYAVGNQGLTEPGSTFKLASMIALLEDAKLDPTDSVDTGEGVYEFYDKKMTDSKPGGYGKITLNHAFEKSSNIAVSRLVDEHFGHQPQKFLDYIHKFGLDEPTGFHMVGEAVPYIKKINDKSWSGISLPWMSIGYELKLSPLHTLTFYNGVANNGRMIRPVIVKKVKSADDIIREYKTEVIRDRICSDETLKKVRMMLEGVVQRGTANNINDADYRIAGKTGTALKIKDGKYIRSYYTSFVGFFPAEKPKYSCIVVIDNPKGFKQYGSDVAAPVFKEIADKVYSGDLDLHLPMARKGRANEGVFPRIRSGYIEDLSLICNEMGIANHTKAPSAEFVSAKIVDNSIHWQPGTRFQDMVPNVKGMRLRDALYLLENSGLKVKYSGAGRVAEQSLEPGARVVKGGVIYIRLS
ncbi:penicillin-binding protein [Cytophagaceae bacterium ABcell3]|nr:penicillin-binding protein [Cytophagaceae bacterium ABcell3]